MRCGRGIFRNMTERDPKSQGLKEPLSWRDSGKMGLWKSLLHTGIKMPFELSEARQSTITEKSTGYIAIFQAEDSSAYPFGDGKVFIWGLTYLCHRTGTVARVLFGTYHSFPPENPGGILFKGWEFSVGQPCDTFSKFTRSLSWLFHLNSKIL